MEDFSKPYIAINHLLKDFHEAITKGQYVKAYEISVDITDLAQQLEDISQQMTVHEE